jgi:sarcosine/dimethylglycine N-methyltransferase
MGHDAVREHYGTEPLWGRVQDALRRAGLDGERVDWPAFAPLDEFHTRGLPATYELAQALEPKPGESVLDVGSGLGGPARLLAAEYGCDVTGIDLSAEFVDVATRLTERAGLSRLAGFQQGDALNLPLADGSFDHAVTLHVAMNIADRPRLYAEIRRVLRPGGRFALYDVVAGNGEPVRFPVPWSRDPGTSFLLTADETRAAVAAAGFRELTFADQSRESAQWFQALLRGGDGAGAPAIGLPVVMGDQFPIMAANLADNLVNGRVGVVRLVAAVS